MSHLVRPLHRKTAEADLARCITLLREAQAYLAERGQAAFSRLSVGDLHAWGRNMKRTTVRLDGERPLLVEANEAHNLGEVIKSVRNP